MKFILWKTPKSNEETIKKILLGVNWFNKAIISIFVKNTNGKTMKNLEYIPKIQKVKIS